MIATETTNTPPRNLTLDVLRGLAILTMILSNYAGEMLKAPHPFMMTVIGSLAAPLFVIISGYLVGYSVLNKNYPFSYFLLRGFLTCLVGVSIDMFLWRRYPFISLDILYLIGLGMPITAFFTRMKLPFKIFLLVLLFGLAPILRANLGYAEKPSFPPLWQDGHFVPFEGVFIVILKHWLIDGWFPIFSWLGILFIGALLAELRLTKKNLSKKNYGIVFLFGLFFLGIGIAFWNQEFRLLARGNYTEMFYPPTLSYYSAYFGGILLLYLLVEMNSNLVIYTPLRLLGVSSLFFYFTHFLVISKFIEPYYGHVPDSDINFLNLQDFLITFFILILFCLFLALILFLIKKRFSNLPFLVKFFIGG